MANNLPALLGETGEARRAVTVSTRNKERISEKAIKESTKANAEQVALLENQFRLINQSNTYLNDITQSTQDNEKTLANLQKDTEKKNSADQKKLDRLEGRQEGGILKKLAGIPDALRDQKNKISESIMEPFKAGGTLLNALKAQSGEGSGFFSPSKLMANIQESSDRRFNEEKMALQAKMKSDSELVDGFKLIEEASVDEVDTNESLLKELLAQGQDEKGEKKLRLRDADTKRDQHTETVDKLDEVITSISVAEFSKRYEPIVSDDDEEAGALNIGGMMKNIAPLLMSFLAGPAGLVMVGGLATAWLAKNAFSIFEDIKKTREIKAKTKAFLESEAGRELQRVSGESDASFEARTREAQMLWQENIEANEEGRVSRNVSDTVAFRKEVREKSGFGEILRQKEAERKFKTNNDMSNDVSLAETNKEKERILDKTLEAATEVAGDGGNITVVPVPIPTPAGADGQSQITPVLQPSFDDDHATLKVLQAGLS